MCNIVIIPALNEAGNIGDLVRETAARPEVDRVIVVNNGSTDDTAAEARGAGATVIDELRRGYGYACMAGTQAALKAGGDILVYMDGDYSSLPSELPRLLAPLSDPQVALVLGSRELGTIEANAMPPHQRFGNWLTSKIINRLYGIHVTDLGPYRAIRASVIAQLDMREMTFGWPTEMKVKVANRAAGHHEKIVEVPVSWHNRRSGRSKVGGTIKGSILAAYYILTVTFRYALRIRKGENRKDKG